MTDASNAFNADRSQSYDARIRRMVPGYETLLQMTDACLASDLTDQARVLMVGAGTGAEVLECGATHPTWRLTAVEPAAAMAAIGRAKTAEHGLAERVHWHEGFLDTLADEEPFDAATLLLVLHFLPDDGQKLDLLTAISERLKPGAPFVLASYVGDPTATRTKKLYSLSHTWAIAHGITPEEAAEKLNPERADMHVVPEERIKSLLRDAGFIDVQRVFQGLLIGAWMARTQR